ncbi:E3 ubiquitin-protein ligase ATL31-like [Primulina tabacum]|uniref:E3 ubiquitin-protein ligase ATL31-like n=1 Tax=Primulina tabacum TaxID=48773 RepID=UPI003F5A894F
MCANFTGFFRLRMGKSVGKRVFAAMDGFFLLSVAVFLFTMVGAQPGNTPTDNSQFGYAKFSPSMAVIIVVLIAVLFFIGFFSIYIRHCSDASGAAGNVRRALSMRNRRAAATRGLDASVLETFPTFSYSEVKDHKIGKGALECAVCLNEFEEKETLRLIPKCDHVFHTECIDTWLESHVTCPVCRANLVSQARDQSAQAADSANDATPQENENVVRVNSTRSRNEEIVIQVDEDRRQVLVDKDSAVAQQSSSDDANRPPRSWSVQIFGLNKFRSNSTGHSLVHPGVNLERFTLKLPAEVRKEMIHRASMKRTGSFAVSTSREEVTIQTEVTTKTPGAGEESSRGGRYYRRLEKLDRGAKSDRWVFFTRGLSLKSPKVVAEDGGEGGVSSTKGSGRRNPVRMPSFNCLQEPKTGDETETRPISNNPDSSPV